MQELRKKKKRRQGHRCFWKGAPYLGLALVIVILFSVVSGPCAAGYFETPGDQDRWSQKVAAWQYRQQRERAIGKNTMGLVHAVNNWTQMVADHTYAEDGVVDHWGSIGGLYEAGYGDCDELSMISYVALKDFGYQNVYRGLMHNDDGEYHMVTLYFENKDDPWILDPTGAATIPVVRASTLANWQIIRVFSEKESYVVEK